MTGTWDCANRACARYHEMSEHRYHDHMRSPRCESCRHALRLIRVRRPMPDAVKRALRERAEVQP